MPPKKAKKTKSKGKKSKTKLQLLRERFKGRYRTKTGVTTRSSFPALPYNSAYPGAVAPVYAPSSTLRSIDQERVGNQNRQTGTNSVDKNPETVRMDTSVDTTPLTHAENRVHEIRTKQSIAANEALRYRNNTTDQGKPGERYRSIHDPVNLTRQQQKAVDAQKERQAGAAAVEDTEIGFDNWVNKIDEIIENQDEEVIATPPRVKPVQKNGVSPPQSMDTDEKTSSPPPTPPQSPPSDQPPFPPAPPSNPPQRSSKSSRKQTAEEKREARLKAMNEKYANSIEDIDEKIAKRIRNKREKSDSNTPVVAEVKEAATTPNTPWVHTPGLEKEKLEAKTHRPTTHTLPTSKAPSLITPQAPQTFSNTSIRQNPMIPPLNTVTGITENPSVVPPQTPERQEDLNRQADTEEQMEVEEANQAVVPRAIEVPLGRKAQKRGREPEFRQEYEGPRPRQRRKGPTSLKRSSEGEREEGPDLKWFKGDDE